MLEDTSNTTVTIVVVLAYIVVSFISGFLMRYGGMKCIIRSFFLRDRFDIQIIESKRWNIELKL